MESDFKTVPPEQVKAAFTKVLASRSFSQSPRQARLLEYLCGKVVCGQAGQIKEYTIAVEVFGRQADFSEKDAVVRVEAHRLRKRLARYYEEEGAGDLVRIEIPSGQYVPQFRAVSAPASGPRSPRPPRWTRRDALLLGGAGALILGTALFFALRPHPDTRVTAAAPDPPATTGLPEIRIRAGAMKAGYVDRCGKLWGTDRYFEGGEAAPGPRDFVGRPADPGLFQTVRMGDFSYHIPLNRGVYELRLHFAEPEYRAFLEVGSSGENQRRFSLAINGRLVLENFDVVADSGVAPVSTRVFKDISPGSDGMLHLKFTTRQGQAVVSGIELVPGIPRRMRPIRFRAHELSYTDRNGNFWTPDNWFVGGRMAVHRSTVAGTPEPELYAGERYGNFSYVIPVPPGLYAVTLHFAETWFRPDGAPGGGVGSRIFDITCNGVALVRKFDIYREAGGPFRAIQKTFHGLSPNGQGKLLLSFSPWQNYAAVKAVEVIDESN